MIDFGGAGSGHISFCYNRDQEDICHSITESLVLVS
jgi:hypothetical protein